MYIRVNNRENVNKLNREIKDIVRDYHGNTPIYVFESDSKNTFRLANDKWVELDDVLLEILKDKYGIDNVKVM